MAADKVIDIDFGAGEVLKDVFLEVSPDLRGAFRGTRAVKPPYQSIAAYGYGIGSEYLRIHTDGIVYPVIVGGRLVLSGLSAAAECEPEAILKLCTITLF